MRSRRGFTLIEVLVALVVFAISVVGLVALESRSIEAQRAAVELREAERVAQSAMAELESRSFLELVSLNFQGTPVTTLTYDDSQVPAAQRLAHYRRPPADIDENTLVPGAVNDKYLVFRRVQMISNPLAPAPAPPFTDGEQIQAVLLEVTVLWIDGTNPVFPPPASARTEALTLDDLDPVESPWVRSVQLRTIRAFDATI